MIEDEHSNSRREAAGIPGTVDLLDERGYRCAIAAGNFTHALPELVFQRHAGFMPIDVNGALDDIRLFYVCELIHQIHFSNQTNFVTKDFCKSDTVALI